MFLKLKFPSLPDPGPGVWKLNTSLLQDGQLLQEVRDFLISWRSEQSSFPSLAVWWDAGKARLKTMLRHRSLEKACSRRTRVVQLQQDLAQLHAREAQGESVSSLIKTTKDLLEL